MKILDLFSGIGGFSLGLERAGFETVAFCEIDPFCRKVLRKHWPEVPIYEDIRDLTADRLARDGIRPSVLTGGFPCQDLSIAGKQAGIDGERSGLWTEYARLIGEIRPRYAIVENVPALLSGDRGRWFGRILGDLAEIGFDAEWHCIPASAIGAPHRRDRVWILGYPTGHRLQKKWMRIGAEARFSELTSSGWWESEPDVGRVANGVPARVHRLRALGNAIIPQIAEIIGHAIRERKYIA